MARQPKKPRASSLKKPANSLCGQFPFIEDFFSWPWSDKPCRTDYGVFALGIFGNYPDYAELGIEAVTEGGDDRYIDLCHVDRVARRAYVCQAYVAESWNKPSAQVKKADDLLNAVSYLMSSDIGKLPPTLRTKAEDLQDAAKSGEIDTLYLLYIHNCQKSAAVANALKNVEQSARTLVEDNAFKVVGLELGLPQIQHHYDSLTKDIVVEDSIVFPCRAPSEERGTGWRALSTTIAGDILHDLWQKHHDDLFSANIRGFLDMLRRTGSVNSGILRTVVESPSAFWAYNNGVTFLSKSIAKTKEGIRAKGVSIINGAQTTGVLGRAPREKAMRVRVPCRFIQCTDQELIQRIIECNNTQNAIRAFDFRSNDPTQVKLRNEFREQGITYVHRRQGVSRLPQGAVQGEVIARFLAAFHGQFQIAYRQQRRIFEDQLVYGEVFTPTVTAAHLYLVQCLADAIHNYKEALRGKVGAGAANPQENECHELMMHASSKVFLVTVVGRLADQIWGKPIADLSDWRVQSKHMKNDRSDVTRRWRVAVEALMPIIAAGAKADPSAVVS